MLKIVSDCAIPLVKGNVARIMGVAPLSPTQERNNLSLNVYLEPIEQRNTAMGLATKVRKKANE